MKKLFYIFASAIVALGAVACQNDIDENINTNEGVETLSFTANFDEATRVAFDENGKTCWVPDDQIEVVCEALGKTYTFTNSKDDVNTFSCTEVGLSKIPGQEVTAIYSYGNKRAVDSAQGIAGSYLVATGRFPESEKDSSLSFSLQNALLYFTAGVDVTFESSAKIFTVGGVSANTLTVTAGNGTQYVAINPAENASFKYSVDGVVGKELTSFPFKAGMKYNLGELFKPVAKVGNTTYATIEDAITAAKGATITLLDKATVSQACQIDTNGHELTVTGNFLALKNYANTSDYFDVVAVTKSNWHVVGTHTKTTWQNSVMNTPLYRINDNGAFIAKDVKFTASGEFKFVQGTADWNTTKGSNSSNQSTIGAAAKYGSNNIKVPAGTYDIYMLDAATGYKIVTKDTPVVKAPVKGETTKLYLNPNIWDMLSARFAAYFYGNGEKWVSMTDADGDGIYEVTIPTDKTYPNVIFVRMNPANTTNNWSNKWNQTGDLTINGNKGKVFKVTAWDKQTNGWSAYN